MSSQLLNTQAVIIGAGPAGAGTSIFLSQKNIDHIVIDKESFPRDKICGDACSGKTAMVLRKANPGWLEEVHADPDHFMPSYGITFVAPNGKALDIPYKPDFKKGDQAPGFITPRLHFDQFLFDKIASPHATILTGAQVQEINRTEKGVIVRLVKDNIPYEVHAPLLIGADGDKSMVRRQFLPAFTTAKTSAIGLRAYYEGVTGLHPDNFLELHFLPEMLPGYFWIFPLPGGKANIGAGILSEVVRRKKINLREQMLYAIANNPNIRDRFKDAKLLGKIHGWGLPMGTEQGPVSGARFLLTGDAASLIDPFSGEGIGNALYSGMIAAQAIEQCLEMQRFDEETLREKYDRVLYGKIGGELRLSATMQKLCRFPWLFNMVVNKAHKSVSLQKTISSMFADLDMRRQLKKPSFYFRIMMNR